MPTYPHPSLPFTLQAPTRAPSLSTGRMRHASCPSLRVGCAALCALLILLLWLWPTPALAQTPRFDDIRPFGPVANNNHPQAVAVGDMNGDGALDLVVGNFGTSYNIIPPNVVYLNDGTGHFYTGPTDCVNPHLALLIRCFGPSNDNVQSVAVGDINGDGALDLVAGSAAQSVVYLNDGTGGFYTGAVNCNNPPLTSPTFRCFGSSATSVAVGDVDGDGALDIIAPNAVYLNHGTGNFDVGTVCTNQYTRCFGSNAASVAVGDVNDDGYLDIVAGYAGNLTNRIVSNVVYLNDRTGSFYTGTVNCNNPPLISPTFSCFGSNATSVAVGDVDGDGALDIVTGNGNFNNSTVPNIVYLNNKNKPGSFYAETANCDNPDATIRCFGPGSNTTLSVAVGDVNGDGALDIVTGTSKQNVVYLNDRTGRFYAGPITCVNPLLPIRCFGPSINYTQSVAVGDVNGDGVLDLVAANRYGQSFVYVNNGASHFYTGAVDCAHPSVGCFYPFNGGTQSVVGDVDSDGDLDIVAANAEQSIVYLNDVDLNLGRHFYPHHVECNTPPATVRCLGVSGVLKLAMGDIDGDGDLDLVFGDDDVSNIVYLNKDGKGNFELGPVFGAGANSVAVGDINGDGALDLVVGDYGPNIVYLNDKDQPGSFYPGSFYGEEAGKCNDPSLPIRCFGSDINRTNSVAVGDVNGDGALDLVAGNYGTTSVVYLNDGTGDFYAGPVDCNNPSLRIRCFGPGSSNTFNVAVGDVNGDGALDLVVGNTGQNVVYLNNGTGHFAVGPVDCVNAFATIRCFGPGNATTRSVAVGDINGDGTLDLITGNTGQNVVYLNDKTGDFYAGPVDCTNPPVSIRCFGPNSNYTFSVVVGDVNGDGALDLVTGNGLTPNVVYLNGSRLTTGLAHNPPALTVTRPVTTGNADGYSTPVLLDSQIIPIPYTLHDRTTRDIGQNVIGHIAAQYSLDGGGHWRPAVATSATITTNLTSGKSYVYHWDTLASGLFGQSDNVVIRLIAYFQAPTGGAAAPGTYRYPNTVAGPLQWPYLAATTFPFRVRGTQVRVVDAQTQGVAQAIVYQLPAGHNTGGQVMSDGQRAYRTVDQGYLPGRGVLNPGDQLFALWPVPGQQTAQSTLYYTSGAPTNSGVTTTAVDHGGVQTLTISAANPLLRFDLTVALEWDASKDVPFQTQLAEDLRRASQALYDWTDGQVALGKVTIYQAKQHWAAADIQILASNQVRPNAARGGIITQTMTLPFSKPNEPGQIIGPGQVRIGPTWNRYGDPGALGEDWPRTLAHELGHYLLYLEDTYLGVNAQTKVLEAVTTCTGTAMSDPYQEPFSELRTDDATWAAACDKSLAEWPDWAIIKNRYPALHMPAAFNPGPALMPFAFTQVELQPTSANATQLIDDAYVQLSGDGLAGGRAYLIRRDARMVDLGRAMGTSILARGAQVEDAVCVFGQDVFACGTYTTNTSLRLQAQPAWSPEVTLTPKDATTVQMLVSSADGSSLTATLYPQGEFSSTIALTAGVTATLTFTQPVQNMLIDLIGSDPLTQHSVIGYALDNGPGRKWSHDTFTSGDGGVVIFPPAELDPDGVLVLQTVTHVPDFPSDLTIIGRAYHVRSNKTATTFHDGSISFQYLGADVLLTGYPEQSLVLHYWNGATWQQLATTLNPTQNIASAALPGPGIYVLTVGAVKLDPQAVSPSAATAGQTDRLTIAGLPSVTYFMQPLTLTLTGETGTPYPLTITSITSQTISVQILNTLPVDLYDLHIVHPGSQTVIRRAAFALYTQPATSCFFDDFKSGLGKWERTGEWDIVTRDGWEAVTDSPNHPYRSAEPGAILTTTLTSQPFDLTACRTASSDPNAVPMLNLSHAYQLLANDAFVVELSTDNGITWHRIASYAGQALVAAAQLQDNEWSAVNWQTTPLNLAAYQDATSVRLRFTLQADDRGSGKGLIIDEVSVTLAVPAPTPEPTPEATPESTPEATPENKLFLPLVNQANKNTINAELANPSDTK